MGETEVFLGMKNRVTEEELQFVRRNYRGKYRAARSGGGEGADVRGLYEQKDTNLRGS